MQKAQRKEIQRNKKRKETGRKKANTNLVGNEKGFNKRIDTRESHPTLLNELCNGAIRDMIPKSPVLATLLIILILVVFLLYKILDNLSNGSMEQVLKICLAIMKNLLNL